MTKEAEITTKWPQAKEGEEHSGSLEEARKEISLASLEGVWPY